MNPVSKNPLIWSLLVSLLLLSPGLWAESRVAQVFPVKDFNEIYVGGDARLEITQGNDEYLRVEADQEVMQRVKVDLDGHKLRLSVKGNGLFGWFGGNSEAHFYLRVKDLRYLDISGAANAQLGDLKTKSFSLNASGAANVDMTGLFAENLDFDLSGASNGHLNRVEVTTQNYDLSGASNLDIKAPSKAMSVGVDASGASNFRGQLLSTAKAKLGASGASHIAMAVSEQLDAEATGASSIDYWGSPKPNTKSSGASSVNGHSDSKN